MPSKFRVKYIFRPLVKLIAQGLSKIGITPHIATMMTLMLAISSFLVLFLFSNLLLFAIFVFLTGIFDGVDGSIAKQTNSTSKQGAFLDSTMDRFSEFVIFFALFFYFKDNLLWNVLDMKVIVILSLFFSIMISYARTRGENLMKGDYDIGLMARSERLFFLFISCIIALFFDIFNVLLFVYMWLVLGTFVFRFLKIKGHIEIEEIKLKK